MFQMMKLQKQNWNRVKNFIFRILLKIFYLEPSQKLQQTNFTSATKLAMGRRKTIIEDTIQICDESLPEMVNKTAWFKVRKNSLFL